MRGTPNLRFAWEIKALKAGAEMNRYDDQSLQSAVDDSNEEELAEIADADLPDTEDLENIASQELAAYDAEMEDIDDSIENVSGNWAGRSVEGARYIQ